MTKNESTLNLPLPKELEEYISKLPSSSVNNSRHIVRQDFRRLMKISPLTAEKILAGKYDIHLDPDRTAKDYGERRTYE